MPLSFSIRRGDAARRDRADLREVEPGSPRVFALDAEQAEIRAEADRLLASGLGDILREYGAVHVTGSHAHGLMVRRNLNLHIVRSSIDVATFFALGARVAALLKPAAMRFLDAVPREGGSRTVMCWAVDTGDETGPPWTVDIWMSDAHAFAPIDAHDALLRSRLTRRTRAAILRIKSQCRNHAEYRRELRSADIYTAVLDHDVRDADEFRAFLNARRGPV
jgi:hypothetical protein